jgi:hypothetical protein
LEHLEDEIKLSVKGSTGLAAFTSLIFFLLGATTDGPFGTPTLTCYPVSLT